MADAAATTLWRPGRPVALVRTRPSRYNQSLAALTAALRERFSHGVIISANRPYDVLRSHLVDAGVNVEGIHFIDCITAMTGFMPQNGPDVMYIDGPVMLEKAGLRAEQLLRRMPEGDRFLLVDSLTTLELYNGPQTVAEMVHGLATRLRLHDNPAAFLLLRRGAQSALEDAVAGYCDDVVDADAAEGFGSL